MTEPILQVTRLNKRFGGVIATDDVDLLVAKGDLHALIGPNGAGKTTLISQISGIIPSDSGVIKFNGRKIDHLSAPKRALLGLARSFQVTSILADFSCQDNVAIAVQAHFGHSFQFFRPVQAERSIQDKAAEVLRSVGLFERRDVIAGHLAHGEKRRLEIAVALAMEPKLLILDEPLAGMSRNDSSEMIEFLQKLKSRFSILLIEHDMDAVFTLANVISVLVYGRVIATGAPNEVREDDFVREAYLGEDH